MNHVNKLMIASVCVNRLISNLINEFFKSPNSFALLRFIVISDIDLFSQMTRYFLAM